MGAIGSDARVKNEPTTGYGFGFIAPLGTFGGQEMFEILFRYLKLACEAVKFFEANSLDFMALG